MPLVRATALAPLLAVLACAGPRVTSAPFTPGKTAARARFAPPLGDAVFERAVRAVSRAGYRLLSCDPQRRRLATSVIEFDAPCGGTTCLARQAVEVVLGYRQARVTVRRELFDGGWRIWHSEDVQGSEEAARALLAQMLADGTPRSPRQVASSRPRAAADPCATVQAETSTQLARADARP